MGGGAPQLERGELLKPTAPGAARHRLAVPTIRHRIGQICRSLSGWIAPTTEQPGFATWCSAVSPGPGNRRAGLRVEITSH